MTKDEALKLALSALDEVRQETFRLMREGQTLYAEKKVWMAIYTIKKVLAQPQPQQEPVAWGVFEGNLHDMFFTEAEAVEMAQLKGTHAEVRPLYTTPPQRKEPKQEPLAWISTGPASMIHWTADKPAYGDDWVPLYTTPPQRTWVGLTDEEIETLIHRFDGDPHTLLDEVNARLKEKNT